MMFWYDCAMLLIYGLKKIIGGMLRGEKHLTGIWNEII